MAQGDSDETYLKNIRFVTTSGQKWPKNEGQENTSDDDFNNDEQWFGSNLLDKKEDIENKAVLLEAEFWFQLILSEAKDIDGDKESSVTAEL